MTTTTAPTTTSTTVPEIRTTPGVLAALGSEWRKLWTLRSTYIVLALAVVLSIGVSALLSTVVGASWSDIPPAERAGLDPTTVSLGGLLLSEILLIVLAVTTISAEYSTGMIRLTFTATPRRARVLSAKLLVVGSAALVVGCLVTFGGFLAGQAIFSSHGLSAANLAEQDVLRTLVLTGLTAPAMPLIAACLAVLIRSAAGTIAAVLGVLFVPGMFGAMLPDWWQENVLRYFPGIVGESLMTVEPAPGALTYLEPGPAVAVLTGWVVLVAVVAYTVLARRDA